MNTNTWHTSSNWHRWMWPVGVSYACAPTTSRMSALRNWLVSIIGLTVCSRNWWRKPPWRKSVTFCVVALRNIGSHIMRSADALLHVRRHSAILRSTYLSSTRSWPSFMLTANTLARKNCAPELPLSSKPWNRKTTTSSGCGANADWRSLMPVIVRHSSNWKRNIATRKNACTAELDMNIWRKNQYKHSNL